MDAASSSNSDDSNIRTNDLIGDAPALLLRSFGDDESAFVRPSFEQKLVKAMQDLDGLGSVIAIGKPNEMFQTMGARRIYVSDENWQNEVSNLIVRSKVIFLFVAESDGLQWEIKRVKELADPNKVLFVFRSEKKSSYGSIREYCETQGLELPPANDFGPLLAFDEQWRPVKLVSSTVSPKKLIRIFAFGFHEAVYQILRPKLKQLGIEVGTRQLVRDDWIQLSLYSCFFCFAFLIAPQMLAVLLLPIPAWISIILMTTFQIVLYWWVFLRLSRWSILLENINSSVAEN